MDNHLRKAVVVGAGPVGCLAAMALTKEGWEVDIYEGRPDARLPSSKAAALLRSINLAISSRGIAAIHAIDPAAADRFMQTVIPMRGRMIHHSNGKLDSQLYDRDGQCINSIDRSLLNEGLLEEASTAQNTRIFFDHKVQSIDFDRKSMIVRDLNAAKDLQVKFDLCIGADGAYSVVRRQMMRVVRMDYQQEYLRDEYLELKMPAGRDVHGQPTFLLDANHLHIWPRHSFMLIALPNKDQTFTCTLFAPSTEFDRLTAPDIIIEWFKLYFPDALTLMGEENVLKNFAQNPRSALICTKSKPYHYKDRAILLGDAAHAMVPFYGQGLNCGLEDVRVLYTLLREEKVEATISAVKTNDHHNNNEDTIYQPLARALTRYSDSRHDDLVAICDLAMANYDEMRHSVTTPAFIFKKAVDNVLYSLTSRQVVSPTSLGPTLSHMAFPGKPTGWLPLYNMVTFRPDIGYAMAKNKAAYQSRILSALGWIGTVALGATSGWIMWIAASLYRSPGHR